MLFLSFVAFLTLLSPLIVQCGLTTNKTYVAYIACIGSWGPDPQASAYGVLPVSQFAAWYINNQYEIAKDVEIQIIPGNCGSGSGNPSKCIQQATQIITAYESNITGFVTGAFTNDQRVLQFVASAFDLPHIVGTASGNMLANKREYPTLLRTSVADSALNRLMIQFMIENNWKYAAIALDSSDYGEGNRNALQVYAAQYNISLVFFSCELGGFDYSAQANLMKAGGYKIIMSILQPRETWVFMDAAHKAGLTGPDYAWMLAVSSINSLNPASMGSYQALLPKINLTQIRPHFQGAVGFAARGAIGPRYETEILPLWKRADVVTMFPGLRTGNSYPFFAFDAVETYARGIQRMLDKGIAFSKANKLALLREMWNNTNFNGTTGHIQFDSYGERLGGGVINVHIVTETTYPVARLYDPVTDSYQTMLNITFYGGRTDPPMDMACSCSAGGTCSHGVCICLEGFTGHTCSDKIIDPTQRKSEDKKVLLLSIIIPVVGAIALAAGIAYYYVHRTHASLVQELAKKQQSDIPRSEIKLNKKIGYGAAGEVFTGLFRGTEVAIKRMTPKDSMNNTMLRQFKLETAVMCTLRHPNIVLFMGSCVEGNEMLLIMEYMNRGSLYNVLHDPSVALPVSLRLHLAYQIASGINFLHQCNPVIIHCDIKSHNVLLDNNWCARISDFGIIKLKKISGVDADTSAGNHPIGTIYWAAPEVLNAQPQTKKSDCYAFGILLWELWHRADPYKSANPINVAVSVLKNNLRPDMDPTVPAPIAALIQKCWATNPHDRPDFEEVMIEIRRVMMSEKSLTDDGNNGAPSGNVVFVATDIQDNDSLWNNPQYAMHTAMQLHNQIIRKVVEKANGYEIKFKNDGFLLAFSTVDEALAFCTTAQRALLQADWTPQLLTHSSSLPIAGDGSRNVWRGLRVRMAVHLADSSSYSRNESDDSAAYVGTAIDNLNHLLAATPGGLIMLSNDANKAVQASQIASAVLIEPFSVTSPIDEFMHNVFVCVPSELRERISLAHSSSTPTLPFSVVDVDDVLTPAPAAASLTYSPSKKEGIKWLLASERLSQRKALGKSLVADVFVADYKGNEVVVKTPFNQKFNETEIFNVKRVSSVIASFQHPNILGFVGITVNPLEFVVEYMPNGNLRNYLASSAVISFAERVRMCKDIANGLIYLSQASDPDFRVHPNFKTSNILVGRSKELKLADFAFGEVYDMLKTLTSVELTAWLAPEQLTGDITKPNLASTSYSFGIIMWEIFTRKVPYGQCHPLKLVTQIMAGLRPEIPSDFPAELKAMLNKCWLEDPENRPTLSAILNTLDRL